MTALEALPARPAAPASRSVPRSGISAGQVPFDREAAPQTLRYKSQRAGTSTQVTVEVNGELDDSLVGELRNFLLGAAANRPGAIIVDLSHVSFLDTAALRTLIAARRRCVAANTRFSLRRPSRAVERMLAATHLDQVFAVEGWEEATLAS